MQNKASLKSYVLKAKKIEKQMGFKPNKLHLQYKLKINSEFAECILKATYRH